jgi:hypothetical protein
LVASLVSVPCTIMVRHCEQDPSSRSEHGKTSREPDEIVPPNGFDSLIRELIFSRLVSGQTARSANTWLPGWKGGERRSRRYNLLTNIHTNHYLELAGQLSLRKFVSAFLCFRMMGARISAQAFVDKPFVFLQWWSVRKPSVLGACEADHSSTTSAASNVSIVRSNSQRLGHA